MKHSYIRFLFLTYIITFVIITLVMTAYDLKSLSISLGQAISEPILDVIDVAFNMSQGTNNVIIDYQGEEHATNIFKHSIQIFKDSYGLIGLYTSGATVLVAVVRNFINDDGDIDLSKSLFKYIKDLFT